MDFVSEYAERVLSGENLGAREGIRLYEEAPLERLCALANELRERIFGITCKALDALGLTDGASHSEYRITNEGRVVVMEIAGRMGGDFIGSDLVQLSTGYDFLQGVIEVALGEPITVQTQALGRSSVVFTAPPDVTCSADRTGYIIYRNNEIYKQSVGGSTDI